MKRYDLVVIGGGSGGMAAARYAAKIGAKVALIDKSERLGGGKINSGCVSSKAFIHAAKTFNRARNSLYLGVESYPELKFEKLLESVRKAEQRIYDLRSNDEYFKKQGITVIHGHARFISTNKLKVDDQEIEGKRFIIATGSRPRIPAVPGLGKVNFHTNETIFNIDQLPRRIAVIGGGVIGCEIASAFNMIGSEVTVFERNEYLSLRVDKPIAEFVSANFENRGIKVRTQSSLSSTKQTEKGIKLDYKVKDDSQHQFVDSIFVSTGRIANLDLGLDNAGIRYGESSIDTDKYGRTSNRSIWAIGDVTGSAGFTHVAEEQAIYAVLHAVFGYAHAVRLDVLPYVIYTSPEVAHVGKTVKELEQSGIKHSVRTLDYSEIDRAVIENKEGLIQISINEKGQLLGATMVGSHATEQIGQYVMAMNSGMKVTDFAKVLQPYPTYAGAPKQIAIELMLEQALESKLAAKTFNTIRLLRHR